MKTWSPFKKRKKLFPFLHHLSLNLSGSFFVCLLLNLVLPWAWRNRSTDARSHGHPRPCPRLSQKDTHGRPNIPHACAHWSRGWQQMLGKGQGAKGWEPSWGDREVAKGRTLCEPRFQGPSMCVTVPLDLTYKTQTQIKWLRRDFKVLATELSASSVGPSEHNACLTH